MLDEVAEDEVLEVVLLGSEFVVAWVDADVTDPEELETTPLDCEDCEDCEEDRLDSEVVAVEPPDEEALPDVAAEVGSLPVDVCDVVVPVLEPPPAAELELELSID